MRWSTWVLGVYCLIALVDAQGHERSIGDRDTLVVARASLSPFEFRNSQAFGIRVPSADIAAVHEIRLLVHGRRGASFRVRVFGNERDASTPTLERDLCPPVSVSLEADGPQDVAVQLSTSAEIDGEQFFVVVDSVAGDVVLPSTSVPRIPDCSCATEAFTRQVVKYSGEWRTSSYEFPWLLTVSRRQEVRPVEFTVDTIFRYPASDWRGRPEIHVADVNGDQRPDVVTRRAIMIARPGHGYDAVPWPDSVLHSKDGIGLISGERTRIIVATTHPGILDRRAVKSGDQPGIIDIVRVHLPVSGVVKHVLPVFDNRAFTSAVTRVVTLIEPHEGGGGGIAVLSDIDLDGGAVVHTHIGSPLGGDLVGVFDECDTAANITSIACCIASNIGYSIVSIKLGEDNPEWRVMAEDRTPFVASMGMGVGLLSDSISVLPVAAVRWFRDTRGNEPKHSLSSKRTALSEWIDSDRRASFVQHDVDRDGQQDLLLFTSDSCRPVHVAGLKSSGPSDGVWTRKPVSGLEPLAGCGDACVFDLESNSVMIIAEKPGLVLAAVSTASTSTSANGDRAHGSTMPVVRGLGLSMLQPRPRRTSITTVPTTSAEPSVRITEVTTMSDGTTNISVGAESPEKLLTLRILTIDGREVMAWHGHEVANQRRFVWDGRTSESTISASGTYVVQAQGLIGSHSVPFQRSK